MFDDTMRVHSMRQLKKRIKNKTLSKVTKGDVRSFECDTRVRGQPPEYKMPPQPIMTTHFGEATTTTTLPGAATEPPQPNLRTHSSKFPIERELVLSNDDKNASKLPLNAGLQQFLPKLPGSVPVAPDHPVQKQIQAWNVLGQPTLDSPHHHPLARPTQLPEDVTALADRDNYGKETSSGGKNPVSKTYHTIKDIISAKFNRKDTTSGSLDELNNASFQRSPYLPAAARPQPDYIPQVPRPGTDSPVYLQTPPQHPYQKAVSQPQLYLATYAQSNYPGQQRRGSVDVTDSDDGGFISKARGSRPPFQPRCQSALEHVNEKPPKLENGTRHLGEDPSGSNVDSGRESMAYSSGNRTAPPAIPMGPPPPPNPKRLSRDDESEWVDIVDSELKNILEPGMETMNLGESASSAAASPLNPPMRGGKGPKDNKIQEYGTDSYNRAGNISKPIAPARFGWPSSSIHKREATSAPPVAKKPDQAQLKRHLFGLDVDVTSTTTRSFDLESLLGLGQSVSDSETDTNGLRNIKHQLEGLESMYSEVLKMLKARNETGRGPRRRYGSISSLPSSSTFSVSARPMTKDKRRIEERRKIRDIKGINKRFQRLESHVVTLARSVAHLSSEMRSQHLVSQELEMLKSDIAGLKAQSGRFSMYYALNSNGGTRQPEPPNLTNPRRVKKLTKFFGDDPPLLRLFLRKLGYEKYAHAFETERVGMIELPYLGEERLQKMGIPLGPRLRILQEAQISLCKDTTLCIV